LNFESGQVPLFCVPLIHLRPQMLENKSIAAYLTPKQTVLPLRGMSCRLCMLFPPDCANASSTDAVVVIAIVSAVVVFIH
jgi:Pyruvate/2-oxoacid:ferredoxin oxidoreductase delta subunit